MGIKHIKLESTSSTQIWLKEHVSDGASNDSILVSARQQTEGVGRLGNKWTHFEGSIAFSFSLPPLTPVTLTPLEIGIHIVDFFKNEKTKVYLKWPNDLLIKEEGSLKKVGGIICHFQNSKQLIVGVGLNLNSQTIKENKGFKFSAGALSTKETLEKDFFHELPFEIYNYILRNRKTPNQTIHEWSKLSCHLNSQVKIVDSGQEITGIFKGIGNNGEALIHNEQGQSKVISGSLWIES